MREIKFEINEMALIGAPNIKTGIVIEISSVVKYKRKGRIPKNLLSLLLRFAKAIIDTINNTPVLLQLLSFFLLLIVVFFFLETKKLPSFLVTY